MARVADGEGRVGYATVRRRLLRYGNPCWTLITTDVRAHAVVRVVGRRRDLGPIAQFTLADAARAALSEIVAKAGATEEIMVTGGEPQTRKAMEEYLRAS